MKRRFDSDLVFKVFYLHTFARSHTALEAASYMHRITFNSYYYVSNMEIYSLNPWINIHSGFINKISIFLQTKKTSLFKVFGGEQKPVNK